MWLWPGLFGSGCGSINHDIFICTCAEGRCCWQSFLLVREVLGSVPPSGDLLLAACFGAIFSIQVHAVLVEYFVESFDKSVHAPDEFLEVLLVILIIWVLTGGRSFLG